MIWNREGKIWYSKDTIDKIKKCIIPIIEDMQCVRCDGVGYGEGCQDKSCGTYQANKILEILQEAENGNIS